MNNNNDYNEKKHGFREQLSENAVIEHTNKIINSIYLFLSNRHMLDRVTITISTSK